jgi:hypothetical protein
MCCITVENVLVWEKKIGIGITSSPAVADGRVYVGCGDDNIYCLDADNGEEIWSYETGGDVFSSPAIAYRRVYIGSTDNKLYCLGEKAELSLVTLYTIQVDVYFYVEGPGEFVVKFYDYENNFENENVFWSGENEQATWIENILHPPGGSFPVPRAVKKAKLVLRFGATESILSSYTVHQSHLRDRYIEILLAWAGCPSCQPAFRAEIIDILLQWASAPP